MLPGQLASMPEHLASSSSGIGRLGLHYFHHLRGCHMCRNSLPWASPPLFCLVTLAKSASRTLSTSGFGALSGIESTPLQSAARIVQFDNRPSSLLNSESQPHLSTRRNQDVFFKTDLPFVKQCRPSTELPPAVSCIHRKVGRG